MKPNHIRMTVRLRVAKVALVGIVCCGSEKVFTCEMGELRELRRGKKGKYGAFITTEVILTSKFNLVVDSPQSLVKLACNECWKEK